MSFCPSDLFVRHRGNHLRLPLDWLEQALTHFLIFDFPRSTIRADVVILFLVLERRLELHVCFLRGNHILDLCRSLLICVDAVIFPVVLAHELGMGVQARPVPFVLRQYFFDVKIMLPCTSLVLSHLLVGSPLLSNQLFDWLGIQRCKV